MQEPHIEVLWMVRSKQHGLNLPEWARIGNKSIAFRFNRKHILKLRTRFLSSLLHNQMTSTPYSSHAMTAAIASMPARKIQVSAIKKPIALKSAKRAEKLAFHPFLAVTVT